MSRILYHKLFNDGSAEGGFEGMPFFKLYITYFIYVAILINVRFAQRILITRWQREQTLVFIFSRKLSDNILIEPLLRLVAF